MTDLVTIQYDTPQLPVAGAALRTAQCIVVEDQDTYELATQAVAEIKARFKKLDDARKAIVNPINAAKSAVQELFTPVLDDLNAAEKHIKGKLGDYILEAQRKQREEQARLDDIARKERERMEKAADKAAAKGQEEKAAALQASAAVVTSAVAPVAVEKIKGSHSSVVWKCVITDKAAIIGYVAAHPEFQHLVDINAGALNKLAKIMEDRMNIPGTKAYQDIIVSVGTF